MKFDRPRRPYRSAARAAQKASTRARILDYLGAQLAHGMFDSLSMEEIARAAEVAPATLYRHFPNREALLDALADEQFFHRLGDLPYPQTPDEVAEVMRQSFTAFDLDPRFVRLYFDTELGRTARSRGRRRRIEAIQAALQPITAGMEASDRLGAEATIAYLASIQAWLTISDEFGLTGAQVGQAVAWAIATLVDDLRTQQARRATSGSLTTGGTMATVSGEIKRVGAGEGPAYGEMGMSVVTVKAASADTEGRYSLCEVHDKPNGGPPMHRHTREDEAYYILEGAYEIHYPGAPEPLRLAPGDYVHVPLGTIHTYKCVGETWGRMLVMTSPAGIEDFFAELSQPPQGDGPPDFAWISAVAAKYGIEVTGPPPT